MVMVKFRQYLKSQNSKFKKNAFVRITKTNKKSEKYLKKFEPDLHQEKRYMFAHKGPYINED